MAKESNGRGGDRGGARKSGRVAAREERREAAPAAADDGARATGSHQHYTRSRSKGTTADNTHAPPTNGTGTRKNVDHFVERIMTAYWNKKSGSHVSEEQASADRDEEQSGWEDVDGSEQPSSTSSEEPCSSTGPQRRGRPRKDEGRKRELQNRAGESSSPQVDRRNKKARAEEDSDAALQRVLNDLPEEERDLETQSRLLQQTRRPSRNVPQRNYDEQTPAHSPERGPERFKVPRGQGLQNRPGTSAQGQSDDQLEDHEVEEMANEVAVQDEMRMEDSNGEVEEQEVADNEFVGNGIPSSPHFPSDHNEQVVRGPSPPAHQMNPPRSVPGSRHMTPSCGSTPPVAAHSSSPAARNPQTKINLEGVNPNTPTRDVVEEAYGIRREGRGGRPKAGSGRQRAGFAAPTNSDWNTDQQPGPSNRQQSPIAPQPDTFVPDATTEQERVDYAYPPIHDPAPHLGRDTASHSPQLPVSSSPHNFFQGNGNFPYALPPQPVHYADPLNPVNGFNGNGLLRTPKVEPEVIDLDDDIREVKRIPKRLRVGEGVKLPCTDKGADLNKWTIPDFVKWIRQIFSDYRRIDELCETVEEEGCSGMAVVSIARKDDEILKILRSFLGVGHMATLHFHAEHIYKCYLKYFDKSIN